MQDAEARRMFFFGTWRHLIAVFVQCLQAMQDAEARLARERDDALAREAEALEACSALQADLAQARDMAQVGGGGSGWWW